MRTSSRGLALSSLGRLDEAMAAYERALALDPRHADAHNDLGNAFVARQRSAEAIEHYRSALSERPDDASFEANLGAGLLQSGAPAEALVHLERALVLAPAHPTARLNRGSALAMLGRVDEARAVFSEVVRLEPPESAYARIARESLARARVGALARAHEAQSAKAGGAGFDGFEAGRAQFGKRVGDVEVRGGMEEGDRRQRFAACTGAAEVDREQSSVGSEHAVRARRGNADAAPPEGGEAPASSSPRRSARRDTAGPRALRSRGEPRPARRPPSLARARSSLAKRRSRERSPSGRLAASPRSRRCRCRSPHRERSRPRRSPRGRAPLREARLPVRASAPRRERRRTAPSESCGPSSAARELRAPWARVPQTSPAVIRVQARARRRVREGVPRSPRRVRSKAPDRSRDRSRRRVGGRASARGRRDRADLGDLPRRRGGSRPTIPGSTPSSRRVKTARPSARRSPGSGA